MQPNEGRKKFPLILSSIRGKRESWSGREGQKETRDRQTALPPFDLYNCDSGVSFQSHVNYNLLCVFLCVCIAWFIYWMHIHTFASSSNRRRYTMLAYNKEENSSEIIEMLWSGKIQRWNFFGTAATAASPTQTEKGVLSFNAGCSIHLMHSPSYWNYHPPNR